MPRLVLNRLLFTPQVVFTVVYVQGGGFLRVGVLVAATCLLLLLLYRAVGYNPFGVRTYTLFLLSSSTALVTTFSCFAVPRTFLRREQDNVCFFFPTPLVACDTRTGMKKVVTVLDLMNLKKKKVVLLCISCFQRRFCFCPRGDTASSRRLFDAISAGCIPILTSEEARAFPYTQ